MPILRKVECSIHTEKGKLAEYHHDNEVLEQNETNITRYLDITGAGGQRFWVEIRALQDFEWETAAFNCLVPSVTVDGVSLRADADIRSTDLFICQYHGPKFRKLVDGSYVDYMSEMFFQPLKIVEERGEDTINESTDTRLQSLGRIEVKVRRSMTEVSITPWVAPLAVTKSLDSVHEKAIKGRNSVYGVQLNGSRTCSQGTQTVHDNFLEGSYITFVFLYRTRDTLECLGLLPKTISPIEIIDDSDNEMAPGPSRLKQEIAALTTQLNKKKDKLKRRYTGEGDSKHSGPPVKRERKLSPRGSSRTMHEVIDLTEEA